MSITNVRDSIRRFLLSKDPLVLCVRGQWGTGKTYTWNDVLLRAAKDTNVKLPFKAYACVSLFGLNSIAEVKREIINAGKPVSKIGEPYDPSDVSEVYQRAKSSGLISTVIKSLNSNAFDALIEVATLGATDQLICIDDIERKGANLRLEDVLGYISHLRDVRRCRVVMLLNDEELGGERNGFEAFLEKVADMMIRFHPSVQEIADIAIPKDQRDVVGEYVRANSTKLGITNVRVVRKILGLARDVAPMLQEYSPYVTRSAVATITLMAWAHLQPHLAPPISYLMKPPEFDFGDEELSGEEKIWSDLLSNYGYSHTDEFDLLLLEGVRNGFFNEFEINKHAEQLHSADARRLAEKQLEDAWDFYAYSFTSTWEEVGSMLYAAVLKNLKNISLSQLNSVVRLFQDFGDTRAVDLVDRYIAANRGNPASFDLTQGGFGIDNLDVMMHTKIIEAAQDCEEPLNPTEILKRLAGPYETKIMRLAAALSVEEFVGVLKTNEGAELKKVLRGITKDLRVINPSQEFVDVMRKASEALHIIAEESSLNHRRAMAIGLIQRLERTQNGASTGV